ncbi:trypsin 5G1-like [Hyposmocoma kahamanoa]|uniref:trypsin 5G1-like n=1 Tax=Hyposmocoma kahamanoa TaxID=1477025 RepID=UPI000E6D62CD|nr:trypsin 5G1-like [Hyposmocoma kahamanoa]
MSITLFLFTAFLYIPAVELTKYDLLVIPVPKGRIKKALEGNAWQRNSRKDDDMKLDVEHYDEPTEMPDVDNFEYSVDRQNNRLFTREGEDGYSYGQGDDKIVGGVEVDINLYPYHVAYGTNCGGAIIDKKWILTAGHCGKKPYIRVGSKYLNQGKKISVKNSFVHPMWFGKSKEHPFDYDFQLLELPEPIKFDDNVQPIKVAHVEDMVIGKVISVTGWGNTEENGPYSTVLRAVRVPIISKEHCQTVPFPYFRGSLTSRMFCAGFQEGMKDACQGDSGGPAVSNDRLLGMVSFGYGCATPGSYGVYAKVAKVREWIEKITGLKLN